MDPSVSRPSARRRTFVHGSGPLSHHHLPAWGHKSRAGGGGVPGPSRALQLPVDGCCGRCPALRAHTSARTTHCPCRALVMPVLARMNIYTRLAVLVVQERVGLARPVPARRGGGPAGSWEQQTRCQGDWARGDVVCVRCAMGGAVQGARAAAARSERVKKRGREGLEMKTWCVVVVRAVWGEAPPEQSSGSA